MVVHNAERSGFFSVLCSVSVFDTVLTRGKSNTAQFLLCPPLVTNAISYTGEIGLCSFWLTEHSANIPLGLPYILFLHTVKMRQ